MLTRRDHVREEVGGVSSVQNKMVSTVGGGGIGCGVRAPVAAVQCNEGGL